MTHDDPHSKVADAVHEGRPAEAQYVRQGRGGNRMMLVLVGGVVLVGLAFLVIWLAFNPALDSTNANTGRQAVDAEAFQGDGATPPAADAPTTATGQPTAPATGDAPNVNAPTVGPEPQG